MNTHKKMDIIKIGVRAIDRNKIVGMKKIVVEVPKLILGKDDRGSIHRVLSIVMHGVLTVELIRARLMGTTSNVGVISGVFLSVDDEDTRRIRNSNVKYHNLTFVVLKDNSKKLYYIYNNKKLFHQLKYALGEGEVLYNGYQNRMSDFDDVCERMYTEIKTDRLTDKGKLFKALLSNKVSYFEGSLGELKDLLQSRD